MQFSRFGIYYTPQSRPFADAAAMWLGWDIRTAEKRNAPNPEIVARPQKYGFHATLKPPFRLSEGTNQEQLENATNALVSRLRPVTLEALTLTEIGAFLAFTPTGDTAALQSLAAIVVRDLDRFRAPATAEEISKREKPHMPLVQKQNLRKWGYPHVMESFRFHMTLTGPVAREHRESCRAQINEHFSKCLPKPLILDSLTLVGEMDDGFFCEVRRFPLHQ